MRSFIRPPDIVCRKALSFTDERFPPFLSIHRSQQSRRGRPSNVFRRFGRRSPIPPLIFTGGVGQKVQNLASISNTTRLWAAHVSKWSKKSEIWNKLGKQRWWPCVLSMFVAFGPRSPENCSGMWTPVTIWRRKCAKSSAADCSISLKFCTGFGVVGHMTPEVLQKFKVKGQRSRSQHNVTGAKICQIMNKSAGDCSILLKFHTDSNHVTHDVPQTFQVNGSRVKVTALHNVPTLKIVTFHKLIGWPILNFRANYPRA